MSAAVDLYRASADPAWWIESVLGAPLWEKQQLIAASLAQHKRVSVASCHGVGKSYTAARCILWFLYQSPQTIVITTAPTDRQVKGILWKEIRVAHGRARIPLGGRVLTQDLKIEDDWWATGFTAPDYDPDRFQGWHEENILIVADEACGMTPQIHEGIEGCLSNENARLLQIGNPTDPDTEFAYSFDPIRSPDVKRIHISAFESPNFTAFGITEESIADGSWADRIDGDPPAPWLVTPEWVADKYRRWGPTDPRYTSRVRGQFPETAEDALISRDWVTAARARQLEPTTPHILGVDVARFGSDKTCIGERRGGHFRILERLSKSDTMETTGHVVRWLDQTGATMAHVDVNGIGAGVVDRLAELGRPVKGINAGEGAQDHAQFLNRRAELAWGLRERFEAGEIDIDPRDDGLKAQLCGPRWKVTSAGKVQLESKDEMRKRMGESPDSFDTMALAFASERDLVVSASPIPF